MSHKKIVKTCSASKAIVDLGTKRTSQNVQQLKKKIKKMKIPPKQRTLSQCSSETEDSKDHQAYCWEEEDLFMKQCANQKPVKPEASFSSIVENLSFVFSCTSILLAQLNTLQ